MTDDHQVRCVWFVIHAVLLFSVCSRTINAIPPPTKKRKSKPFTMKNRYMLMLKRGRVGSTMLGAGTSSALRPAREPFFVDAVRGECASIFNDGDENELLLLRSDDAYSVAIDAAARAAPVDDTRAVSEDPHVLPDAKMPPKTPPAVTSSAAVVVVLNECVLAACTAADGAHDVIEVPSSSCF